MPVDKMAVPGSPVAARFHDHSQVNIQPSVVAVGNVPVNLVVVTRIAERAKLRAVALSPSDAIRSLPSLTPIIVVIDGGVDNCECDTLLDVIQHCRRNSGQGHPRLLFLSTGKNMETQSLLHSVMDAVVAKPIVPERLEAVLADLAQQSR
ncbi:response regulator [Tianweitania sp.]|uniref:response regulator n=1 Tax=Tianweitania sp. TaxID=2021634 RepID=UPI00289AB489|nr:response regulator [Tianweitania sp.]